MGTNLREFTKAVLSVVICLGISRQSHAQSVQEGNVWAPSSVKIDAKLTEWNNSLQANNKTTNLYYTIANDDKNLYLAVKSTDPSNNTKIVSGGITFTINTSGKKKEKDAFAVTFPVVNRSSMGNSFRQRGGMGGDMQRPDSAAMANMRTQLLATAKEITLKGFTDIPDSIVSIYNEYGIKAAVGYDNNGNFIYELALPLNHLGLSVGSAKELAYNIKVNGMQFGQRDGNEGNNSPDRAERGNGGNRSNRGSGFGGREISISAGRMNGRGGMSMQDMMSPTDFWGKYTLAKTK
ncbi:hypothetical protein HH214_09735 [Mucilaginibacter robiniae]|uniref:Uncharacterized protein n=1 Tax=Mucilaginibacter robiniae TaxID=2728022 RepID=A0A7L5E3A0_9SPHI|nr:hypothetical protein [Mucilaginibacter robiniae]QJD96134.1 hypothetical protein HH214_09735 [Mucilaginibacter robiniae]